MGLADHGTVGESGGQTFEILSPMYRGRMDVEVDQLEAEFTERYPLKGC